MSFSRFQYIATADVIRSNHIKNQFSLYALTKLKFSKHHLYFKYLLILSGDINLHPGPVKYPCSVCAKPVRKRIISCEKCGLWIHKKCDPTLKLENNSSSICKPCQNKSHDNLDNVWVEFPFDDDFFGDKEIASSDEKINNDAYKTDPVAEWKAFNKRGLHLIHLNINSLLSKIDELREIARKTRATVVGITESKLDGSVLDGEINIDGYELVRSDRNRHGGGVACYIRSDISFNVRGDFSSEIENIFFDILLPKTKPILIGILYRPPEQSKFLDNLSTSISQTCSFNEQEVYISGDLNINLINSQKHTPNGIKRYKEFCSLYGIEQLLTLPTRITKNSSSLLDHVLTNSADRISQFGIVNVGLSDHQLIYCTRKVTRTRLNAHKYVKMRSLKYYSEDLYVKKLKEIDFPDYSNFKDINEACSDFTEKVASVIDEIAPIKEVRVKSNSQDWFDAEINEEIERRDKLLAKFKKSRSHSDNENYKKSRNKVERMIKDKKKNFVIGKINDNIGKPKECILDNILSGEHMAAKVLNTVHNRLKFLYRKQKFLSLSLRRLLCNALIQPHFDYACAAWYPLLNKRQSKRIQIAQNKCIRYCLNLDNKAHVGTNEFLKINWLPTKKRVKQCICVNVFKFFNQMSPQYTAEIFHSSSSVHNTRRATQKLDLPFRKSCIGQKTLSYIGPRTWNNLPAQI